MALSLGMNAPVHALEAPEVTSKLLESADHYLPVYRGGASHAVDPENRVQHAKDELGLWRAAERREGSNGVPGGLKPGERSTEARLNAVRSDLELSDQEFEGILEGVVRTAPVRLNRSYVEKPLAWTNMPIVQSLYTELAHLCGAPGAVSLYAAGEGDDHPALTQYESIYKITGGLASGNVTDIWRLGTPEGTHGYAWIDPETPEVLIVAVATTGNCAADQMIGQVAVGRVQ